MFELWKSYKNRKDGKGSLKSRSTPLHCSTFPSVGIFSNVNSEAELSASKTENETTARNSINEELNSFASTMVAVSIL